MFLLICIFAVSLILIWLVLGLIKINNSNSYLVLVAL